ncbi:MAG TPA: hypothetical protein VEK73_21495 [Xanthobacteraceae bacterium]|nr:hypothetical protein [Xanthobacteraceae bacterium]
MDVVVAEKVSEVWVEAPNDAVPSGTLGLDVQLVPVFQLGVAGAASHMPSTARAEIVPRQRQANVSAKDRARRTGAVAHAARSAG